MCKKKKKIPHRDFIAKELLTSGKFKMRVVQNKKKKIKKFDWKKESESSLKQIEIVNLRLLFV